VAGVLDPLEGYTVAVTADRRAREQAELLERRGATVVRAPAIRTLAVSEEHATRKATRRLFDHPPDYVVANTGIGMRGWVAAAAAWGWDEHLVSLFEGSEIWARGPKAAGTVTSLGVPVAWQAPSERLDELIERLLDRPIAGRRIAFQQHGEDCADVTAPLRAAGADVVDVPVYRWTQPVDEAPLNRVLHAIVDRRLDAVTFTSAPTVRNVLSAADSTGLSGVRRALDDGSVLAVAVGPVTADALRAGGVGTVVAPARGRLGTMVRALTEVLAERRIQLGGGVVVQGAVVAGPHHRATLTDKERTLLRALVARPGAVVPRRNLTADGEERALEAAVHRLRRKLGPGADALATVAKRGYRLDLTAGAPDA
jgi:uroporphyrinogen-III synthase